MIPRLGQFAENYGDPCRRPKCNKVLNVITFCPNCNKLLRPVPTNGKYFFPDNDDVRQVDHISGY